MWLWMSSTQIKKKLYIKINTVAVEIVTTVFVAYFGIVDGGKNLEFSMQTVQNFRGFFSQKCFW